MVNRKDEERSASSTLGDHGDEPGVDGTELVVLDALGDGDAIVAVLGGLTEHMPKLGAAILGTP